LLAALSWPLLACNGSSDAPSNGPDVETLAQGEAALGLQLDATHLYWIRSGTPDKQFADGAVVRMPKAGGPVEVLATGFFSPDRDALVMDDTSLYYLDSEIVMQLPKSGGTPVQMVTLHDTLSLDLAQDATHLWVGHEDGEGFTSLKRLPKAGGSPESFKSSGGLPLGLFGDFVYFAHGLTLSRLPLAGDPQEDIAQIHGLVEFFAANQTHLFFTLLDNFGSVLRVPLAGGVPEYLSRGYDHPRQLVLNDTEVFFSVSGGGEVRAIRPDGGGERIVAAGQASPYYLAIDQTHLYWTCGGDDTVRRVALS
jgi:hypothetical protein